MGDIGDIGSACTPSPEELLVLKPLEVLKARPLELLPLCAGIVCRSNFRAASFAAGLATTGGLAGIGGGVEPIGFLFICAPAGVGGVGMRLRAGLRLGDVCRPRTGDSTSSGSDTSATE